MLRIPINGPWMLRPSEAVCRRMDQELLVRSAFAWIAFAVIATFCF